jgi:hypothetical protein
VSTVQVRFLPDTRVRAALDVFERLQAAGRQFPREAPNRVAILPDQDELAALGDGMMTTDPGGG